MRHTLDMVVDISSMMTLKNIIRQMHIILHTYTKKQKKIKTKKMEGRNKNPSKTKKNNRLTHTYLGQMDHYCH